MKRRGISVAAVILALFLIHTLQSPRKWQGHLSTPQPHEAFSWDSVTPSKDLRYVPCGRYQCARLLLPMDYEAPEDTRWSSTVAIALMKLSANVSIADPRYRGEIFVNPGGPGVSGIEFIQRQGDHLSSVVNDESAVYDIVGFDPRGMLRSTPRFSCFKAGNLQGRAMFSQKEGTGPWSEQTLPAAWARSAAFGQMCDPGNDTSEDALIKYYMSTASVAADMVGFIEASGALRGAKLRELMASVDLDAERIKELEYRPGEEKIQYWGFSYGTMLGGYFASMFPGKIKRLMLDGVSYLPDWAEGKWMGFLANTDQSLRTLFHDCFAAKERCALFDPNGTEAIESTVMSLLKDLKDSPIPIWKEDMLYPDVLTQDMVLASMFTATYGPYQKYPALAKALHALKDRQNLNMSDVAIFLPDQAIRSSADDCASPDCAVEDGSWYHEANVAVSCSDTDPHLRHRRFAEYKAWSDDVHKQSPLFGHYFASSSVMACHGWPVRSRFRFDGPFGGRTSHPLLFIGNELDPMAPVHNMVKGLDLFPGSGMVLTAASGHCSPRVPSRCRSMHIRRYMQSGKLPEPDTLCKADYVVFEA